MLWPGILSADARQAASTYTQEPAGSGHLLRCVIVAGRRVGPHLGAAEREDAAGEAGARAAADAGRCRDARPALERGTDDAAARPASSVVQRRTTSTQRGTARGPYDSSAAYQRGYKKMHSTPKRVIHCTSKGQDSQRDKCPTGYTYNLSEAFSSTIFVQLCSSWQHFNLYGASRCPSAISQLLAQINSASRRKNPAVDRS